MDLYAPVKRLLQAQGYTVKGEVKGCDVVAVRGEEPPVVVELKRTLTLSLVLQAVDRLAVTDAVYLAVPASAPLLRRRDPRLTKLLRMLGVGLVAVDATAQHAWVVRDPGPYAGPRVSRQRQRRLLGEFAARHGDPQAGGADRTRGLLTAYRQRALVLARHLAAHGPSPAREIAAAVGDPKARAVLYRDVYGWFSRPQRGVYALTPVGRDALAAWDARLAEDPTRPPSAPAASSHPDS